MAERPPSAVLEDLLGSTDEDGPVFDAPWQARTFGLAVALHEESDFDWEAFRRRRVAEAKAGPQKPTERPETDVKTETGEETDAEMETGTDTETEEPLERIYYERWLSAFERVLVEEGVLSPEEITARAAEFAAEERTAEEFVEGERTH